MPRFRGHLILLGGGGIRNAENETAVSGGVPPADGRAGPCVASGRPSARAQADADLTVRVRAIHARSRGTYGAPRITRSCRIGSDRVNVYAGFFDFSVGDLPGDLQEDAKTVSEPFRHGFFA